MTTRDRSPGEASEPSTVFRRTRTLLQVLAVLHTIAAAVQPMLAGAYLTGEVDAIDLHRRNALTVIFSLAAAMIVAAALNWRLGGGRGWPAIAALGLLGAEILQIVLGFERQLAVHIPLGVAIVTLSVLFTIAVLRLGRVRLVADVTRRA